ncbi:MAG: AraC family transcriptional regulator [Oscillospiraceae bacterium]
MLKAIYPVIGNEKSLPFYLTGIGVSAPEYHVVRETGLVSHQFLYTTAGRGKLVVDGCSYLQSEGSLFYMPPAVPHEYFPENGEWTTHWVVFRGEHLPALMREMGFSGWLARDNADLKPIAWIFDAIFSAANTPLTGAQRCSVLLYELILAMKKLLLSPHTQSDAESALTDAVAFININYAADITLEQLARLSGVSLQYFCRIFKAGMGMRPMEYIARKRIAQAKIALANTDAPICAVAAQVGYRDLTYFGMVFKKHEGISPSAFRKNKSMHSI